LAKRLVDSAKKCGADAIKFQTFKASSLVTPDAKKAKYQFENTQSSTSQFEMLKKLELNRKAHIELFKYCKKKNITFLSSPFDEESVDMLDELGVTMFKIPSGEITNTPFLKYVARKRKPIILSTGMSTLKEVKTALDTIYSTGNKKVTLLHCVTEYPAPYADINLNAMITMRQAFKVPVGYSDHTSGIEIAIASAALGAEVIEKHFTLDRSMKGPDHKASIEPTEFKKMIVSIRNVEIAMGNGKKIPAKSELKNIDVVRKSIIAKIDIKKGEILTTNNLTAKRPGSGISPYKLDSILGKKAKKNFKKDELIKI
jgi:N,N'-diacetyllegionaminate synthase